MPEFRFDDMVIITSSEAANCDAFGTESGGCDCDSPN